MSEKSIVTRGLSSGDNAFFVPKNPHSKAYLPAASHQSCGEYNTAQRHVNL
jgi:hypothetical protein